MEPKPGPAEQPDQAPTTQETPETSRPSAASVDAKQLEEQIIAALKTCHDPEIPVNIYELGLIYDIDISPEGNVGIRMTLTSPACPAAGAIPPEVQRKVAAVPGVQSVQVDVVWDPIWTMDMMSEAAKLQLGIQ
ncbi:MAG: DUF59 domain-containing protein [Gemmataceae bacterium]